MAISALWKASNRPALGVMTDAPLLIDGNTTTGYSISDSEPATETIPCTPLQVTAELTGVWVGGGVWLVTAIDTYLAISLSSTSTIACNAEFGNPFVTTLVLSYAIEYSADGTIWLSLTTGTVPNSAAINHISWSGAPFLTKYVRVVVVGDYYAEGLFNGAITAVSYLNEIEITATEQVPDPEPPPPPDPDDPGGDADNGNTTTVPPPDEVRPTWTRNCGIS